MIIGQVLHASIQSGGTSPLTATKPYYSPWFARGGNGMHYVIDIINISNDCYLQVEVETKNSENDDSSIGATTWLSSVHSTVGEKAETAGAAVGSASVGFDELVRYKYIVNWDESTGTSADWVHFRILNPSWSSNGA